jgi:SAF domain
MLPKHLPEVVGRLATRSLKRGEPLDWSMIGPGAKTGR